MLTEFRDVSITQKHSVTQRENRKMNENEMLIPKTYINTSLNYQSRPEFNRTITTINYGFGFRSHKSKLKHDLIPVEIYMVKAKLEDGFKQDLIAINDFFLLNSFQDHITTLSKYTVTYNNQQISIYPAFFFFFSIDVVCQDIMYFYRFYCF